MYYPGHVYTWKVYVTACPFHTHAGLPPPPNSITVSYTDTVVIIAWQPPSVTVPYSQCVSSYTIDSTIIVTSTTVDTSVSVSLAGLSPGVYTVKVASVDYANRTGSYSNVLSFELKGLININFLYY